MKEHTILVVEDDLEIREALADVLESEGYHVAGAQNGREGLDLLGRIRPCLVLLDLMMPVMSGLEFLKHLRESGPMADLPVIVVSAWQNEAERAHRAQGFLKKPVDLGQLLGVVRRFCPA